MTEISILSGVVYSVVNYIKSTIIFIDRPHWKPYLVYVQFIGAMLLVWFSGANVFEGMIRDDIVGQIATALAAGAGSEAINSVVGLSDSAKNALKTTKEEPLPPPIYVGDK